MWLAHGRRTGTLAPDKPVASPARLVAVVAAVGMMPDGAALDARHSLLQTGTTYNEKPAEERNAHGEGKKRRLAGARIVCCSGPDCLSRGGSKWGTLGADKAVHFHTWLDKTLEFWFPYARTSCTQELLEHQERLMAGSIPLICPYCLKGYLKKVLCCYHESACPVRCVRSGNDSRPALSTGLDLFSYRNIFFYICET